MGSSSNLFALEDILKNFVAEFSPGYLLMSTILSVVVGILAAIFVILASVFSKNNRVFGIIVGILQIAGAVGVQKYSHVFLQMEKFTVMTATGSNMAEAQAKLQEQMMDYFMGMLGDLIVVMICGALMFAAWITALIYIILSLKNKPKVFAAIALVLHIARYMFIVPFDFVSPFMGGQITDMSQMICDILYYGATLLPFLFLFVGGIIAGAKAKKQGNSI